VFFRQSLDEVRKSWSTFDNYFLVLNYFVQLGDKEVSYIISKARGIYKIMDFIANNSPPFHQDTSRKKMGGRGLDPDFTIPTDILAHLVKSCITKGMLSASEENKFSDSAAIIPHDDVSKFMTKQGFTTGFLQIYTNNSVSEIVNHLSFNDIENSRFFIEELLESLRTI
jgi:hypothetical protein